MGMAILKDCATLRRGQSRVAGGLRQHPVELVALYDAKQAVALAGAEPPGVEGGSGHVLPVRGNQTGAVAYMPCASSSTKLVALGLHPSSSCAFAQLVC